MINYGTRLNLHRRRHKDDHLRTESVHSTLSQWHRAYSVFIPAPENLFPLFQAIFILPDPAERSNSPRSTHLNLKDIFERLRTSKDMSRGTDEKVIDALQVELQNVHRTEPPGEVSAVVFTASVKALQRAGFVYPAQISSQFSGTSEFCARWNVRLEEVYSEAYTGSPLHRLMRKHAQPIFQVILEELSIGGSLPSGGYYRGLLGIVTSRTVSKITVSRPHTALVSLEMGVRTSETCLANSGVTTEKEDHDLYGVSALRFIVFPVERLAQNRWSIYRGINVCDSDINEDDGSFTQKTRDHDAFYTAKRWVLGRTELTYRSNDYITVQLQGD